MNYDSTGDTIMLIIIAVIILLAVFALWKMRPKYPPPVDDLDRVLENIWSFEVWMKSNKNRYVYVDRNNRKIEWSQEEIALDQIYQEKDFKEAYKLAQEASLLEDYSFTYKAKQLHGRDK